MIGSSIRRLLAYHFSINMKNKEILVILKNDWESLPRFRGSVKKI